MKKLLVSIAVIIGFTSCNDKTEKKKQEEIKTIKTEKMKKVLFVLTSHEDLGDTGEKTGFWIEEFASPYYLLKDKGVEITIASPKGGQPPIDPKSASEDFQTPVFSPVSPKSSWLVSTNNTFFIFSVLIVLIFSCFFFSVVSLHDVNPIITAIDTSNFFIIF